MASRDEIVDQIASFALFADLTTPQLERIAHMFEEEVHPEGERVLRQGLSGSAFHVILDGEAAVIIDGNQRATLSRGDFFGEMSVIDGLPRVAQVVTTEPTRCLALASWEFERLVLDHPTIGLAILRGLSARLRSRTEPPQH